MTTLDTGATHVAATTPYAWPYDGNLDPGATAVVVVTPASVPWPDGVAEPYASAGAEVVDAARTAGATVISVVTADPGARGTAPAGEVASPGVDGFYASRLEDLLRSQRIERLILVGFGLETCVHSTMRSANDRGFECLLVADACAPYDPSLAAASVSMIEMSGGIFGAVGSASAVVDALNARSTP